MPRHYRIRLVANADGTVSAENEHGARLVAGPSGPDRFSAVELLAVALGACSGMDFVELMGKQRTPLAPVELEVTADRSPGKAQRLAGLRVTYWLDGPIDDSTMAKAERARRLILERTCTVSRTLIHGAEVEHFVEHRTTGRSARR